MADWRQDLSVIREIITPTPSAHLGWRADFLEIARNLGGEPQNWRESVNIWAKHNGIAKNSWRENIIALSIFLVPAVRPENWRQALRFIRLFYEGNPPEPPRTLFLLNTLPKQPNAVYRWIDSEVWDDNLFWVEG